jgi:hypothetical protein
MDTQKPKLKNKLGLALTVAELKEKELGFRTLLGKEKKLLSYSQLWEFHNIIVVRRFKEDRTKL